MLVIAHIPSTLAAPAAGIVAGGVLGNSLSAAWNGMAVPNPLVVRAGDGVVAFNLADVWTLVGMSSLVAAIGIWLIRNRELLPSHAEVRSARAEAFRRLFENRER